MMQLELLKNIKKNQYLLIQINIKELDKFISYKFGSY